MNARIHDPQRAQRELLAGSELLRNLPPPLLDTLVASSRLVQLSANQHVYEAGDTIREAFILFNGSVNRAVTMPSGATRVVQLVQDEQLLGPGEIFGASRYQSSCTSIHHCLLVALDARKLREQSLQNPELSGRIIRLLAQRQCATEFDVTGYHYGLTGAQRLLDYLLEQADGQQGIAGETTVQLKANKKMIAARIGMTAESFSRNLRELADSGVIAVDGRNVYIQHAALQDASRGDGPQQLHFGRKPKGSNATGALSSGALVNRCGRLRLLSQRLALAWIAIVSGLSQTRERVRLHKFERDFVRYLMQLERLDLATDLRQALSGVQAVWPTYQQALISENAAHISEIFALSEALLDAADRFTSAATRQAGLREASHVNTAGRNRMLSQRIAKLFLLREWPAVNDAATALSTPCCQEFEHNQQELRRAAADWPDILAQLAVVDKHWHKFMQALCPDLSHAGKSQHARVVLVDCERLLRSIDTLVKLFERRSQ